MAEKLPFHRPPPENKIDRPDIAAMIYGIPSCLPIGRGGDKTNVARHAPFIFHLLRLDIYSYKKMKAYYIYLYAPYAPIGTAFVRLRAGKVSDSNIFENKGLIFLREKSTKFVT